MVPKALSRFQRLTLPDPHGLWNACHLSRRAGVLVLLSGQGPDFDVVLTVRSKGISYGGDPALPGGKADTLLESPLEVALREANEEIGLNRNSVLPIRTLPGYVSSKQLLVVPTVAWAQDLPKLEPKCLNETQKVFTSTLRTFLPPQTGKISEFNILSATKTVGQPMFDRVWGLTAHILIDTARMVLGEEPKFEFYRGSHKVLSANDPIGNMGVLQTLERANILQRAVKK